MNNNNTVFIYAKRSNWKDKQDLVSINKQIEDIKNECRKKWLQIEWIYIDNESILTEWKKIDFNKMINELKERNIKWKWKKIDYLYIYKKTNLIVDLIKNENLHLQILSIDEN